MKEKRKEKRIEAEIARMACKFELVNPNQRTMLEPLLQNAAFMKVTLEDLQEKINAEGVVDYYQNGANQHGVKTSATLQSYNALVKNYASVIKTISQLVPYEKETTPAWDSELRTPEEDRAAQERRDREHKREIDLACEYQRQERAATAEGKPFPSFSSWKAAQETDDEA